MNKPFTLPKPKMTKEAYLTLSPSDLILTALEDLSWAERSPRMRINMGTWADVMPYEGREVCYACLAGCSLIRSIGLNPKGHQSLVSLVKFDPALRRRAVALDRFRDGNIKGALEIFYQFDKDEEYKPYTYPETLPTHFAVSDYYLQRADFKKDLREIAALLKEHNF